MYIKFFSFAFGLSTVIALVSPSLAKASPWTLKRGDVSISTSVDVQWAREEFLDERKRQSFPLRGAYRGASANFGIRFGITDRLELGIDVPLRLVSYTSDPVILLDSPAANLDFYQENIIDLSQSKVGLGDIWITGRYNLLRKALVVAFELRLKTPTGYDGPSGTFGDSPESAADFVANVGTLARPENVTDDVTLGDGQVDINPNFLFGASFKTNTFVRFDIGYNIRLGGAGHQILGSFKVGQKIGRRLLLYLGSQFAFSVTKGRVIGISVAASDPDLPAREYGGTTNLLLREVRLERDTLDLLAGFLVRVNESTEVGLGYLRTIWGRNTSATNALFIGLSTRTSVKPRVLPEEAVVEEAVVEEVVEEPVETPVHQKPKPTASIEESRSIKADEADIEVEKSDASVDGTPTETEIPTNPFEDPS